MIDWELQDDAIIIGSKIDCLTIWDFVDGKCGLFDWFLAYQQTPEYANEVKVNRQKRKRSDKVNYRK